MNNHSEMKVLVKQSFLSDEQKTYLLKYLEKNGDDEKFYEEFDILLAGVLTERLNKYDKAMSEYQNKSEDLKKALVTKEEKFGKKLKKNYLALIKMTYCRKKKF